MGPGETDHLNANPKMKSVPDPHGRYCQTQLSPNTPQHPPPAPGRPRASGRCAFPFPGPVTCRCPDLTLQPFLFSLPDTPQPSRSRRMAFHPWQCHTAIPYPSLSGTGHAMPFTCTIGTSYTPWEQERALAPHVLTQGNYLTPLTVHVGCPRLDHPCEISKQCPITSVPPTEDLLSLWAPMGFPPSLIHTCYFPPIGSKIGHPKSLVAEWDTPTPRHVRYPRTQRPDSTPRFCRWATFLPLTASSRKFPNFCKMGCPGNNMLT